MRGSPDPRLLYLAPLVLLAHVVEEAPGLMAWMNGHFELGLTTRYFVGMSTIGLIVTVAVAVPSVRSRSPLLGLCLIGWLSFLMLANGVLHLAASLLFREYVPGMVTGGLVYLPYFAAATFTICKSHDIRPRAAMLAASAGAVPMVVQGVSLLAYGRRALW